MKDLPPPEASRDWLARSVAHRATTWVALLVVLLVLSDRPAAHDQEPKTAAAVAIQITFLPPPLEHATYSLGIFDAKTDKFVRHLQEIALEKDFTIGLNGLITAWNGDDDDGKRVDPGRYSARGYAVPPLKIEGEDIQGNDWAADDEKLRFRHVTAIAALPSPGGLAVLAELPGGTSFLARFSPEGKLLWHRVVTGLLTDEKPWLLVDGTDLGVFSSRSLPDGKMVTATGTYRISDGTPSEHAVAFSETRVPLSPLPPGAILVNPEPAAKFSPAVADPGLSVKSGVGGTPSHAERTSASPAEDARVEQSFGKDRTTWTAAGLAGLFQAAPDGTVLRKLEVQPGEPLPVAVSADLNEDRLYLLEERNGWQRVRGLSWVGTKEENGHPVSTWQTFFERSIRTGSTPAGQEEVGAKSAAPVEVNLDENPLAPGKPQKIRLIAVFDAKGSYLATKDGLRLRQVSERPNLTGAHLAKGKSSDSLVFSQSDGAATDVFSITGARRIMEFDAGEFELTATGEKPAGKAVEPPDL